MREMFKSGVLSAGRLASFKNSLELKEIDRHTLASLVKRIWVYEGKQVEIEFYFTDQYRTMEDFNGTLATDEGFQPALSGNAGGTAQSEMERGA